MKHWAKSLFAIAAPLLLTGCLWGPGKFASDLTVRKDGSFVLDYRGELVLQLPPDAAQDPWKPDMAKCTGDDDKARPCNPAEVADQKRQYEERSASKRKDS